MFKLGRHMPYRHGVCIAVASVLCALPAEAHGAIASPTAQSVATMTAGLIQQAENGVSAPPTGGAAVSSTPALQSTAKEIPTGGASIAPAPLPGPDPAQTASSPLRRSGGAAVRRKPTRVSPTPDPMPVLRRVLPAGQANLVLIIRINSPGNDGSITQINGATTAVLRPSWIDLRKTCGSPGLLATNAAAGALRWATSCARALSAASAHDASTMAPTRVHRPALRVARQRPAASAAAARSFEPIEPTVTAAASAVRRTIVHASPHRISPRHRRSAPTPPPPPAPVPDWVPTVPGPASTITPGGGGQGSAALGLLAITCLTLLPGAIGRRAWPTSVLRETLRSARLERPG